MTPYIHRLLTFTMILWLCLGIGAYLRVPEIIQKQIDTPQNN